MDRRTGSLHTIKRMGRIAHCIYILIVQYSDNTTSIFLVSEIKYLFAYVILVADHYVWVYLLK